MELKMSLKLESGKRVEIVADPKNRTFWYKGEKRKLLKQEKKELEKRIILPSPSWKLSTRPRKSKK